VTVTDVTTATLIYQCLNLVPPSARGTRLLHAGGELWPQPDSIVIKVPGPRSTVERGAMLLLLCCLAGRGCMRGCKTGLRCQLQRQLNETVACPALLCTHTTEPTQYSTDRLTLSCYANALRVGVLFVHIYSDEPAKQAQSASPQSASPAPSYATTESAPPPAAPSQGNPFA